MHSLILFQTLACEKTEGIRADYINLKSKSMGESQYVYLSFNVALLRVKIPNFDRGKHEFEIEQVFYNPPKVIPTLMGLFSHRHIVYMVGGKEGREYSRRMYMFDPTKLKLPVENLDDCIEKPRVSFEFTVLPSVIPAKDKIYFLSRSDCFGIYNVLQFCFHFQSFDPTKNCFETLPCPPCKVYHKYGHFFLRGFIYLFVKSNQLPLYHAYTFNTTSSMWSQRPVLVSQFLKNKIPIPCAHRGSVGLSDHKFPDKTHILVALDDGKPTAYRVQLGENKPFKPKSYRFLEEVYKPDCPENKGGTHLADMGGGRFCVIYSSYELGLVIYVFEIDFALEHSIQTSASTPEFSSKIPSSKKFQLRDRDDMPLLRSCSTPEFSSKILSSKKFQLRDRDDMPLLRSCSVGQFCLASASPSTSNEEDQESDYDKRKKRRRLIRCMKVKQV